MEVGHQRVDHFVLIARIDKNLGVAEKRRDKRVLRCLRGALKRSHRGGAHGDDFIAARFRGQHRVDHLLRHFGVFRVHHVIFDALNAYRLERPRADVQRDKRHLNAFRAQALKQRLIKNQACGRCRDSARFLAVDGLIKLAVSLFIRAFNVRRQRHMADTVQNIQHRARVVKLHFEQRVVARGHRGVYAFIIAQQKFRARLWRFRRADMGQHAMVVEHTLYQYFNFAAARLAAKEARRDHAGIVKHQQIAGVELIEQIGESAVREISRRPVERQQATGATLGLRIVSYQGFG
ncbi:hypothetical protein BN128_4097 [Cronobacter sakazakii 696]|nr:hypothetical protein BN128_4097 [Cronobacter sakazakii 696]